MSNMAQGRDLADPRTAEALAAIVQTLDRLQHAAGAHRRRHPRGRTGRVERLEGPAAARACSGRPRSCSAAAIRRSTARRGSRRRRRRCARRLPGWSDPDFDAYAQRHYPAYWIKVDLPHLVAHAKLLYAMAARGPVAGDRSGERSLSRRHRDHRRRARPSAAAVVRRRRLRGGGRQHRRRADLHHRRRLRARHDLGHARLRARRGRAAAGKPHGPHHRAGPARRDPGRRAGQAGRTAAATRAPAPSASRRR